MEAPLWLLLGWGGIGAIDFVYNHIYRYRLYAHASSFREHGVHTLLALVLTATVVMLVFIEMGSCRICHLSRHSGPRRDLHSVGCVNRASVAGTPGRITDARICVAHGYFSVARSLCVGGDCQRPSVSSRRGIGGMALAATPPVSAC